MSAFTMSPVSYPRKVFRLVRWRIGKQGVNILNATFERRRQGAFAPSPVVEARLAIASLSIATPTTNCAPRIEILFDRLPAMPDLSGEDDLAGFLMNNRETRRF